MKQANKGVGTPAEFVEGRALAKGNSGQTAAVWTQRQGAASPGLMAVRQVARRDKKVRLTALLHHVDVELLRRSYWALKRQAAPGVDGVTWAAYEEELQDKLSRLHQRVHEGTYRARPARRVLIPKADGSSRPLGIQCLEDKIVQQAVAYVLDAVYEDAFCGFSYGFRPGRSPHDALDALHTGIYRRKINWVLDADIQDFFGSMSHEWMIRFLEHRIGDRRLIRLIKKWLTVGTADDTGQITRSERGTPQGSVLSPVLANVYLHYVFDLWVQAWRKRQVSGDVVVVRYADDIVMGFQFAPEARGLRRAVEARMSRFGLTLHRQKTRLLQFGRYAMEHRRRQGLGRPETFDFLGFTHHCDRARSNGWFVIRRRTIRSRMVAKLQAIKLELRRRLHRPISETGQWLRQVIRGHLNYYAVSGNGPRLRTFVRAVAWYWFRSLRRRSQRTRMTQARFWPMANRFLPPVRILHEQPMFRFDATTRGRSPVR